MRIATWNVNSIRVRLSQLQHWLEEQSPDVVMLQEIKCQDSYFPARQLQSLGYHTAQYGQPSYNGVALLSKAPMFDIVRGNPFRNQDPQARVLSALISGIRFISVYVPNGSKVGTDKYEYKLAFLRTFNKYLATLADGVTIAGGDYNIAPADRDVYDIADWGEGNILVSEGERTVLQDILNLGYSDAQMLFERNPKETFTWWDYRAGNFQRNRGLRIDLMLLSQQAAARATGCTPQWAPRGWERPSDHAPLVLELT